MADALDWHREIYDGVALPESYFAGQVRDSDPNFPELVDYEVEIDRADNSGPPCRGSDAAYVPGDLARFEEDMREIIAAWDTRIPARASDAALQEPELFNLAMLLAVTHGEWIRIHPFANGNGRTARLWVHWLLARYDLPRFIHIVPRPPDERYALAAQYSLCDENDQPMAALFVEYFARLV